MAIPTLKTYPDYTFVGACEHPDGFYVAVYRQTSTYTVSEPHTWRLSVFDNTSPYAETDTDTFTYPNRWGIGIPMCSDYDGTIWIRHSAYGINSYSISATGTFTLINFYAEDTTAGAWISDITESEDYIWLCHYNHFCGAFTKGVAGTITAGAGGVLLETATVFSNSTDLTIAGVRYNDDYDAIIMVQNGGNDDKLYCYDATTFALNWSKEYPDGQPYQRYKTDSHGFSHPDTYQARNGNAFRVAWDADSAGSIEMTEDELAADAYATLVAGHGPTAWYDFKEASGATHFRDKSGNLSYDMTIVGTWILEDTAFFNTHNDPDNKSIDSNAVARAWASTLDWSAQDNYSFEIWGKFNTVAAGTTLFQFDKAASAGNWQSVGINSSSKFEAMIYNGGALKLTSPVLAVAGQSYHIVLTWSSVAGWKLYVDGVLHVSNSSTYRSGTDIQQLHINYDSFNSIVKDQSFDTLIMYPITLSAAQIQALYEEGKDDPYAGTYRGQIQDLGPLSYWPCDDAGGAALDVVGTYPLTAYGSCSFQKTGIASGGYAVETAQVNNTHFRSTAISELDGATAFTVEFWMYWDSDTTTTNGAYTVVIELQLGDNDSTELFNMAYFHTDTLPYFAIKTDGVSIAKYVHNDIDDDAWHHHAVTVDTVGNTMKWYMDGVLIRTGSGTITPFAQSMYLTVGNGWATDNDWVVHAKFQHVAMYLKVLTPTEIMDNYLLGSDVTPTAVNDYEQAIIDDGPFCYWPLDDVTGTVAVDRMGKIDLDIVNGTAANMTATGITRQDNTQPAFNFNGTNQYLKSDTVLHVGHFAKFTAEIVAIPDGTSGIRDMFGPSESGGWYLRHDANVVKCWAYVNGSGHATVTDAAFIQAGSYTDRVEHWMLVWDNTNLTVFRNGVQYATVAASSPPHEITYTELTGMVIGGQYAATITNFYDGKLAHVAFYDKALTRADAVKRTQLLNGFDVANFPADSIKSKIYASGPKYYFPLDELNTTNNVFCTDLMVTNDQELQVGYKTAGGTSPTLRSATFLNDGFDTHSRQFRSGTNYDWVNLHSMVREDITWDTNYTHAWTFEVFFKTTASPATVDGNMIIWIQKQSDFNARFFVSTTGTGGIYVAAQGTGNSSFGSGYNDGIGHHLVVTYNGLASTNGEFNIYVDGVLIGTAVNHFNYSECDNAYLGLCQFGGSYQKPFIGDMVHAAFYDKILALVDIRDHFATAFGLNIDSTDDYADAIIVDAPLAYYRHDDATDSLRLTDRMNAFHGTSEDVLFQQPTGIVGSTNKSASYDGATSFGYVNSQIIESTDDFTVETWFKLDTATDQCLIHRGQDGFGSGWSVQLQAKNVLVAISIVHATFETLAVDVSVTLSKWHHVVATWEQGVGLELWLDGLKVGIELFTETGLRSSSYGWGFGRGYNNGVFKAGRYDETAIYDRVLADSEILEHFTEGTALSAFDKMVIEDGPSAWWEFDGDDESADDTFRDKFGVHNGTWEGTATDAAHSCRVGSTKSAYFPTTAGNGYLEFDTDAHFTEDFSNTFTVECWIEFSLHDVGVAHSVVINDGGLGAGWSIQTYNGYFGLWIRQGSTGYSAVNKAIKIPQNVPVHIVGVVHSGGLKLYINGRYQAGTSVTITDIQGTQPARIGRLGISNQSPASGGTATTSSWEGYIDDIILYDGEPLNAARVEAHYLAGSNLSSNLQTIMNYNPVMYMPCDDQLSGGALEVMSGDKWIDEGDTADEASGWVDRAYYFDGASHSDADGNPTGNFIHSATDGSGIADLDANRSHTVMAWMKLADRGTGQSECLMVQYRLSPVHRLYYYFYDPDGSGLDMRFYISTPNSGAYAATSSTRIPADEWVHLAWAVTVAGGTISAKLYINGVEVSYASNTPITFASGDYIPTSTPLSIGEQFDGSVNSNYHVEGYLDELLWYPFAMTVAEINELKDATGTEYQITGTVKQDDVAVERDVRLYRRDTGALVRDTTSVGGVFDFRWKYLDPVSEYYVIAFDDDNLPIMMPITQDRLSAVEVE